MSFRSMLEFNHDKIPQSESDQEEWLDALILYLRSGSPRSLPAGVTYFHSRHHSSDSPLGEPPCGWDNDKERIDPSQWQGDGAWQAPHDIKLHNCRLLIYRMAQKLKKGGKSEVKLADDAMDYLKRARISGSVLR